jgi:hypothetical protein
MRFRIGCLVLMLIPAAVAAAPSPLNALGSCGPSGHWTTLSPPRARSGRVAVYDEAATPSTPGRMLVFGGSGGGDQDVWSLDLSDHPSWTLLNSDAPHPAPRLMWNGVIDRARDRVILFGGWDFSQGVYVNFDDTWTFSLTGGGWAPLSPVGVPPAGRIGATMIHDPVHDRVILFGGDSPNPPGSTTHGDVWQLSLSDVPTWTPLAPAAPSGAPAARYNHGAVYDPEHEQMLVFGGWPGPSNDTWALKLTAQTEWVPLVPAGPSPPARTCTAVYDPTRQCMTLYGGVSGATYLGDVWRYFPASNTWSQVPTSGAAPTPRAGHFMVFDERRSAIVVYAGQTAGVPEATQEDVFVLDDAGVWSRVWSGSGFPPARADASAAVDPVHERLVVFGGIEENASAPDTIRNDTWVLDLSDQRWQRVAPTGGPAARHLHDAFWDAAENRMLVFGGTVQGSPANPHDLWSLTLDPSPAWTSHPASGTSPPTNQRFVSAFDPVRRRLLSFRFGRNNPMEVRALSVSPPIQWAPLATAGPFPTRGADRVFHDTARDRALVFTDNPDQLWSLSLAGVPTWSLLATTGSAPDYSSRSVMLLDPIEDRLLFYYNGECMGLSLQTLEWCALAPLGAQTPSFHGRTAAYDPTNQRALWFTGAGEVRSLQWGNPVGVPERPAPAFALSLPRPNPSAGTVSLDLVLERSAPVEMGAYDLHGRVVRSMIRTRLSAGRHTVQWDGRGDDGRTVRSGVYFVQVRAGGERVRRKVFLTR